MPAGNWFGRYTRKIRMWFHSLALFWTRRRLRLDYQSSNLKEARLRRDRYTISVECISQTGESQLKLFYADHGSHPVFLPWLQTDRRSQHVACFNTQKLAPFAIPQVSQGTLAPRIPHHCIE